jgi:hypothetical protein
MMCILAKPDHPRYFLALLPFGWYRVHASAEPITTAYAVCAGRTINFVSSADDVPRDALARGAVREINRDEARAVAVMRSRLVPIHFYLSALAVRIDAAQRIAPFYAAAGHHERAAVLRARVARLNRRVGRLARVLATPIAQMDDDQPPVQCGDECWRALDRIADQRSLSLA